MNEVTSNVKVCSPIEKEYNINYKQTKISDSWDNLRGSLPLGE